MRQRSGYETEQEGKCDILCKAKLISRHKYQERVNG